MMTSWHENAFRIAGPLWGESIQLVVTLRHHMASQSLVIIIGTKPFPESKQCLIILIIDTLMYLNQIPVNVQMEFWWL